MDKIIKTFKRVGWWLFFLFGYVIILMLLNYTKIFTFSTIVKFNYVCVSLILFIFGFLTGKSCEKRAYIEGIKISGIIDIVLIILNITFIRIFNLKTLIYYLLIMISFTLGSMIGINLKKVKKK